MTSRPFALLLLLAGCSTTSARSDVSPVSPHLRTVLGGLCDSMKREACRAEFKAVPPEDLATLVVAELGEQEPEFEQFLTRAAAGVKPTERKARIEKDISDALATRWSCQTFDELWANQRPACP